jgi:suppressor for copper-sensitivity B
MLPEGTVSMNNLHRQIIFLMLLLAILPVSMMAQDQQNAHAELFTRIEDTKILIAIKIKIDPGWHLYSDELGNPEAIGMPTSIELTGGGINFSKVKFPKPHRLKQEGLGTWINSHEGEIILHAIGEMGENSTEKDIEAIISGQTCSDTGTCLLYRETIKNSGDGPKNIFQDFSREIISSETATIIAEVEKPAKIISGESKDYSSVTFPDFKPQQKVRTHNSIIWLLIAFIAGMLMNVMPCVLPVVSIKILSFVQQAGESRTRILALGSAFGAGMLVVFWMLAATAIYFGMNWGDQFQSQAFMVILIAVIFAFALSLLGVFELGVPKSIGKLSGGINREGIGDAFFKGMLATVMATPCSGPFLGSTLAWTLSQPSMTIFMIFTMLGLGMALPYVILTASPKLLKLVPKPGEWMVTFKEIMGFVLLITTVYLMISLRQELLLFANAFLVFVGVGCWFWGRFANMRQSRAKHFLILTISASIIIIGAYLSFGTFRGAYTKSGNNHIEWEEFSPERFQALQDEGRNIFVDFSATWCPNCKYNEKVIFESEEITKLIKSKNVVSMIADMTHEGPKTEMLKRLRKKLGGHSIPFLAVFPADAPMKPFVRSDIVSKKTMKEIFNACPDTE